MLLVCELSEEMQFWHKIGKFQREFVPWILNGSLREIHELG